MSKAAKDSTRRRPQAKGDQPDYAILIADNSNDASDILAGDTLYCKTLRKIRLTGLDNRFVHVQRICPGIDGPTLTEDTVRLAELQPDHKLKLSFDATDKKRAGAPVFYPSDKKGVRVKIVGICLQRARKLR